VLPLGVSDAANLLLVVGALLSLLAAYILVIRRFALTRTLLGVHLTSESIHGICRWLIMSATRRVEAEVRAVKDCTGQIDALTVRDPE
jgi:hypothetical protein